MNPSPWRSSPWASICGSGAGRLAAASYGFYVFAGFYGVQRFLWEFLKPYPMVLGPFNVFHLAAAALVLYAAVMLRVARPVHALA